jgi:F-type H+-transporting ATPase subunit delta
MLAAIARPYAKAAFEFAEENKLLTPWLNFLQALSPITQQRVVRKALLNPTIDKNKIVDLFVEAMGELPLGVENFLRLLATKHRLNLLSRITELFRQYYSRQEKVLAVNVSTAVGLTEKQHQHLLALLEKHFGKAIEMKTQVKEELLGGVEIRAEDLVIDASVRGKLARLAQALI